MSRSRKRILFTIGGAVALLLLATLAVLLFVDTNRYKRRFEARASKAVGMDVRVGGRFGMSFFPKFHFTVEDGRILGEHGVAIISAKRATLRFELLPLLRNRFRLRRIEMLQPTISIERDPEGRFNVGALKKAAAVLVALDDGGSLSFSDGTLLYGDSKSGEGLEATNLDLAMSRVQIAGGTQTEVMKGLSVRATLACGKIRTKNLTLSTLKVLVDGNNGVFQLEPITMNVFGGQASGNIRADLSGPVPLYQVRCSLPRFRIEEFVKTLSPEKSWKGTMDFTASLSMQGKKKIEMVQTAAGEMSLRGDNLILQGNDIDRSLSKYKSSQNFNLVDVGAVFFAGPLGLAVTKGYNFASLLQSTGGSSTISTLVSNWKVERGVVKAKDVAMATAENRIALQGGLDFVNGRFAEVTVAMINEKGCAKVKQVIRGPFAKPEVERPKVLESVAGPVLKLFKRVRKIFPDGPCEVFYSGSVTPPK